MTESANKFLFAIKSGWNSVKAKFYGNNFLLLITVVLFIIMYTIEMFVFKSINYDKLQHFLDMLNSNAGLIVIASGMTMVLIIGGIDISVGSQVAMYCMMLAVMMERQNINFYVAITIVFITGIVFGFVQGWLISYLKLQPFIVTLAGMFFARGMTAVITADTISIRNADFAAIANKKLIIPFGSYINKKGMTLEPFIHPNVVLAIAGLIVIYILLSRTRFGRNVYAIGGGEQSSMLMGLNVRLTKLIVYTLNGLLVAFGAFLFCLNSSAGNVEQARGFEMNAVAAAVIGGTPLTGGVGNVIGSFAGVMIQETINSFVRAMSMSSWWAMIFIAALLALFIILQSVFAAMRKKARKG
ncbi:MAG: sugar ABC transporter permease YjfF [Clostridiales bacterium]|jgi:simple sugar transport system permease protein|nr:sugar ABC transporter permease YjfF [Clostridiales bacterium]